jgi:CubicO group peptidase (beta-lactamase class C family)
LWIGVLDYGRIEDKTPMQKCSIVYSASIGKTYCAVAVMQLVDDGKLNLDGKINQIYWQIFATIFPMLIMQLSEICSVIVLEFQI